MKLEEHESPCLGLYRHVKTGNLYELVSMDYLIEETLEQAVLYKDQKTLVGWVRPAREFFDGRFVLATAPIRGGNM